jgi:hypothetical protein
VQAIFHALHLGGRFATARARGESCVDIILQKEKAGGDERIRLLGVTKVFVSYFRLPIWT